MPALWSNTRRPAHGTDTHQHHDDHRPNGNGCGWGRPERHPSWPVGRRASGCTGIPLRQNRMLLSADGPGSRAVWLRQASERCARFWKDPICKPVRLRGGRMTARAESWRLTHGRHDSRGQPAGGVSCHDGCDCRLWGWGRGRRRVRFELHSSTEVPRAGVQRNIFENSSAVQQGRANSFLAHARNRRGDISSLQ